MPARPLYLLLVLLCCAHLAQAQSIAASALDADGVQKLLPSAPGGTALALGAQDPNQHPQFGFDYRAQATPGAPDATLARPYWHINASPLRYASGGSGYTARLHLYASAGKQGFNWKTQLGFLSNPADVKNQEFTVYVRVHQVLTPSIAQVTLKIRGGRRGAGRGGVAHALDFRRRVSCL